MGPQAVQSKTELCKKLPTTREVDEKDKPKENYSLEEITAWSYDKEGHAEKCVERCCELAKKDVSSPQQGGIPCMGNHQTPPEGYVCVQIVLYLARIGRPGSLWSVNTLARSLTKWNKACGKSLLRLISCNNQTTNYRQFCHLGDKIENCKLGLFQDASFAGVLRDSKSTSGGLLHVGSHTFVPISWICKKLTAVSHSSESLK